MIALVLILIWFSQCRGTAQDFNEPEVPEVPLDALEKPFEGLEGRIELVEEIYYLAMERGSYGPEIACSAQFLNRTNAIFSGVRIVLQVLNDEGEVIVGKGMSLFHRTDPVRVWEPGRIAPFNVRIDLQMVTAAEFDAMSRPRFILRASSAEIVPSSTAAKPSSWALVKRPFLPHLSYNKELSK